MNKKIVAIRNILWIIGGLFLLVNSVFFLMYLNVNGDVPEEEIFISRVFVICYAVVGVMNILKGVLPFIDKYKSVYLLKIKMSSYVVCLFNIICLLLTLFQEFSNRYKFVFCVLYFVIVFFEIVIKIGKTGKNCKSKSI